MISDVIAGLIGNYLTTCFVIGLIVAAVQLARYEGHRSGGVISGIFLNAFVLWGIGIGQAVNFIMHSFLGDYAAKTIGWAQSPFQLELAFSSLGVAVIAFIAFRRRAPFSSKVGVVIAVAIFGFGAAGGHIFQMIVNNDYAANNTGLLLVSDILTNAIGVAFVIWHSVVRRHQAAVTDAAVGRERELADA